MKRLDEAQLGLEGLASKYGDEYRLYRAILRYFDALIDYDPHSLRDCMEMLPYSDNDKDFIYRTVEVPFIKLVLIYDEYKARYALKRV